MNNKFLISFLKNHTLVSKMEPNELVEKSGDLSEETINNNELTLMHTIKVTKHIEKTNENIFFQIGDLCSVGVDIQLLKNEERR